MSTVEKAMSLLDHFAPERPELGLADFRHLSGRDKATTYRHLCALEAIGLLEQDPTTRRYRIGAAVLRLASLREMTVPRRAGARAVLPRLAAATGETAHASILEDLRLSTLDHQEAGAHATRVVITDATLPLHATASGHAVLAFGGPRLLAAALESPTAFTSATPVQAASLEAALAEARASGFGVSDGLLESDVHGIAAPVFDGSGVAGAIAVASIRTRMTPALGALIRHELAVAARAMTNSWGGKIPAELEEAWARTLAAHDMDRDAAE